jgi:formate hydrogenlyase subunit 4
MNTTRIVDLLVHLAVAVLLPPLLLGVINKTKAFFGGRVGPPLVQPYRDIWRLMRKDTVVSTTTTWVFRAGPVVSLATAFVATLLVPLGGAESPLAFGGNFVLFAYLLGLGRFFTILAALDTGSAFEGMGAAREATFSALAEPGLLLGLVVLARQASSTSLSTMLGAGVPVAWRASGGALVLVVLSLFMVLLVENSRIPFDDPNTHLELTMIHEVMVLDHSGPALGLIEYAASLKLLLLGSLVARLILPMATGNPWGDRAVFVAALVVVAVVVGVVESSMARLRLLHVPRLLVASSILSVFGIVLGG